MGTRQIMRWKIMINKLACMNAESVATVNTLNLSGNLKFDISPRKCSNPNPVPNLRLESIPNLQSSKDQSHP